MSAETLRQDRIIPEEVPREQIRSIIKSASDIEDLIKKVKGIRDIPREKGGDTYHGFIVGNDISVAEVFSRTKGEEGEQNTINALMKVTSSYGIRDKVAEFLRIDPNKL